MVLSPSRGCLAVAPDSVWKIYRQWKDVAESFGVDEAELVEIVCAAPGVDVTAAARLFRVFDTERVSASVAGYRHALASGMRCDDPALLLHGIAPQLV